MTCEYMPHFQFTMDPSCYSDPFTSTSHQIQHCGNLRKNKLNDLDELDRVMDDLMYDEFNSNFDFIKEKNYDRSVFENVDLNFNAVPVQDSHNVDDVSSLFAEYECSIVDDLNDMLHQDDSENIDEVSSLFQELENELVERKNPISPRCIDSTYVDIESDDEKPEVLDHKDELVSVTINHIGEDVNSSYCGNDKSVCHSVMYIPAPLPFNPSANPLDNRCSTNKIAQIDSRIPQISLPRMDGINADAVNCVPLVVPRQTPVSKPVGLNQSCKCFVCKNPSRSSSYKKAYHKYKSKRSRRNWLKGPRYKGRSFVATNRKRANGRFIDVGW